MNAPQTAQNEIDEIIEKNAIRATDAIDDAVKALEAAIEDANLPPEKVLDYVCRRAELLEKKTRLCIDLAP